MRWLVVVVWLAACSSDGAALVVDLRTDLVPGVEVVSARTEIEGGPSAERAVARGDDLARGVRIAELGALAPGATTLRVRLLDARGVTLADRPVRVDVRGRTAVTVVITRDCAGVACPASDAAATACLGGRCVTPECTPEHPELCPAPECSVDADCAAPSGACAVARCASGTCLDAPEGACGASEYCDPEVGCRAIEGEPGRDAGIDAPIDGGAGMPPPEVAPAVVWARAFGGGYFDHARAIAPSISGIYFTGATAGGIDFGGGPLAGSPGGVDTPYAARLDPDGAHLFSRTFTGTGVNSGEGVAVGAGFLFVLARINGSIDADLGAITTAGGDDSVLIGIDGSRRTTEWQRQLGGPGGDRPSAVVADETTVVAAGTFSGSLPTGTTTLTSTGQDAYVAAYDALDGTPRWAWQRGRPATARTLARAAGHTWAAGEQDFGAAHDAWVVRLDEAGGEVWSRTYATSSRDGIAAIAVGPTGSAVIVGSTEGFLGIDLFGVGPGALVAQLDAGGDAVWATTLGAMGAFAVALDPAGGVYVAGACNGPFVAGGLVVDVAPDTRGQACLVALAPDGTLRWGTGLGRPGVSESIAGIVATARDALFVVGTHDGASDVGARPLDAFGETDVWAAHLARP